jgi:hypothetical protein
MKLRKTSIVFLASIALLSCTKEASSTDKAVNVKASDSPVEQLAKVNKSTPKKVGNFVSGEHSTQGKVKITNKNGKSFLELEQSFKTSSSGPDLVVILHRSDNILAATKAPSYALKSGDYVILGRLKKFSGAQVYEIPNNINLADYKSAAIWCRKFNATFGVAKLSNS